MKRAMLVIAVARSVCAPRDGRPDRRNQDAR
jgi:hypothetical protein